jgi:hypothetical protein
MDPYPRLARSQLLERMREHARQHGYVSHESLLAHDRILLRSIRLHFVGIDAARHAARVPGPPYFTGGAKRGPKPGTRSGPRVALWSRERVVAELRRIDRAGESTRLDDLIEAGYTPLVHAATLYAGGLSTARRAAGVAEPRRHGSPKTRERWTKAELIRELRRRHHRGESLASTRVPQTLYRAVRYKFGSWPSALESVGIDPASVREYNRKYTREEIIRRLRSAARRGSDLKVASLKGVIDPKAVLREFGTLAAAIHAANLDPHLSRREHGLQKWSRERVIKSLRDRAARGEHGLTSNLSKLVLLYFDSTENARAAAAVPSPADLRRAQRHDRSRRSRGRQPPRRRQRTRTRE